MISRRPAEGVNIVGYHHVTSGLGEAARQVTRCLVAAGYDTRTLDVVTTNSPRQRIPRVHPRGLFDTTIAVVTASELPSVWGRIGGLRTTTRRLVGVWFWELSVVPDSHLVAVDIVDEIWAPTRFIYDAYCDLGASVKQIELRVDEPTVDIESPSRWRARLGCVDDVLFVTSFDLFSVIHRKNPLGAIDSFIAAFGHDSDQSVRLVVRVLNGSDLPNDLDTIMSAASRDPRITVIDEHLPVGELCGLLAAADCFVSLHRSEGLGLHLAEAMWLGTPVLATRYGGNLDFMDDSCAALVDAQLVPVGDGRGAYPSELLWAEPDTAHAARWMRMLAADADLRRRLAVSGRSRMEARRSAADVGAEYGRLLGLNSP